MSDTYKPHAYEEAVEIVPPAVAATLTKGEEYGIRWWNRSSQKSRQVSEHTQDGTRRYRRKVAYARRAPEEWVGAPVPVFLPRACGEGKDHDDHAASPGEEELGAWLGVEKLDELPVVRGRDDHAHREARRQALPLLQVSSQRGL